jgi:predicted esterase YcpF (UPF0227 family)
MSAAPHQTTHLLYLHGFRSSPRSTKARRMAHWVAEHRPELVFACPQLPPSPREAIALARETIAGWPRDTMALMGSSLGGFYATVLAQELASPPAASTQPAPRGGQAVLGSGPANGLRGCRKVLLNPAVDPARDLAQYIGEHSCWQNPDERFFFRPEFVAELRALQIAGPLAHPERLLAVIAKGDEVLDWREMHARYAHCHIKLLEGSDHGLTDFDDYLSELTDFLLL